VKEFILIRRSAFPPLYVHEDPIGSKEWFIEVLKEGKPQRWIFVTSSFVYERPARIELSEVVVQK
jgi:hypothetical protein